MRRSLLAHLACPACQGALALSGAVPEGEWVEEALLRCAGCAADYPILEGVPRFPVLGKDGRLEPVLRTRATYDFTWERFGDRERIEQWEKDSYRYDELVPRDLVGGKGTLGLDAGCGGGADLLRYAAGGADIIGVDLSRGAVVAARAARHLPNVHVVQADVHHLPFRPGAFDFIYSFGVLHHLPEPSHALKRLARLLKPGASLVTYLYEDFSDRSSLERWVLAQVAAIRRVTSRLPKRMLYALCWMMVPWIWLGCSVPARLLRGRWPRLAERLPFRHTLRWPVLASDLFDRFAPPVEWRFSREGVLRFYEAAGLERVEVRRFRGWVSWGFAPAGRLMPEPAPSQPVAAGKR